MRVLGPNDLGNGILVEWDAGTVSPNEFRNAEVIRESYGQLEHSKPFEFYATLQKYGVPNRNGRVYPEKILKREAENYKKAIEKGTSLSELNHPESSLIDFAGGGESGRGRKSTHDVKDLTNTTQTIDNTSQSVGNKFTTVSPFLTVNYIIYTGV